VAARPHRFREGHVNGAGSIPASVMTTPLGRPEALFRVGAAERDGQGVRAQMRTGPWMRGPDGRPCAGSLGVFLNGHAITEPGPRGETIVDRDFLLLFNAHSEPVEFTLPAPEAASGWQIVVDTASQQPIAPANGRNGSAGFASPPAAEQLAGRTVLVADRAIMVLRAVEAAAVS